MSNQTWILAVSIGNRERALPNRTFDSLAAALTAMHGYASKRYADIACYCGQGEHCACGGWISGPLSTLAAIESDRRLAAPGSYLFDEIDHARFRMSANTDWHAYRVDLND